MQTSPVTLLGPGVTALLLALAACNDPHAPQAPRLSASNQLIQQRLPIAFTLINACTGEAFTGTGYDHLRFNITLFPNYHESVEENLESFQGVTAGGVRYVVPGQASSHLIMDTDLAPVNTTEEESLQFIRQGEDGTLFPEDDFYLRIKVHGTINANGVVTVEFSDLIIDCK